VCKERKHKKSSLEAYMLALAFIAIGSIVLIIRLTRDADNKKPFSKQPKPEEVSSLQRLQDRAFFA
jgi:hypothetical protein